MSTGQSSSVGVTTQSKAASAAGVEQRNMKIQLHHYKVDPGPQKQSHNIWVRCCSQKVTPMILNQDHKHSPFCFFLYIFDQFETFPAVTGINMTILAW